MKIMKSIKHISVLSIVILMIIIGKGTNAQQAWDIIYDTDVINNPSTKLSLDSDGNFFIGITSVENIEGIAFGKFAIYKISPEGEYLDSLSIEYNNTIIVYNKSIISNDTIYLFGIRIFQNEDSLEFTTAKYDTEFNIIDAHTFQLPDFVGSLNRRDVISVDGKFLVLGVVNSWEGIALLEFNRDLDSVNFAFYEDEFVAPFSIVDSYDNNIVVTTTGWDFNNDIDTLNGATGFAFFSGDSLLPMFTRRIGSMMLHNGVSIKQYPDSTYIVSAEHHFFSQRNLGVFKISNDFIILDSLIISSSPIPYPNTTFGNNLDYSNPNAIYFGSTENVSGAPIAPVLNHIRVSKIDSNLNVIWEKFYGGDANYFCYTVKATEDGGCIVLATRFDFENDPDPNHLGTYILKLGPDGVLTGIEESNIEVKEVLVYPNPGWELNIATGFNNYSLTLFDINGKAVYTNRNLSRDSKHELSFLPGGLYIYRITAKNGEMLDTGKWVKE